MLCSGHYTDMTQRVQALMLAAGSSQRFGSDKRFHKSQGDTPIILRALRNLQSVVESVVLVVAPGELKSFSMLLQPSKTCSLKIVEAEHAGAGMGASLACGIRYCHGDAVLIALADMPFIQSETIAQVAKALREHPLVVPHYRGRPGHPVGFQSQFFTELTELGADEGGKKILQHHRDKVKKLVVQDPGILMDIDTPADLTMR